MSPRLAKAERYTLERKGQFLLENAATAAEYRAARREVKSLGLNPAAIPHVSQPHAKAGRVLLDANGWFSPARPPQISGADTRVYTIADMMYIRGRNGSHGVGPT